VRNARNSALVVRPSANQMKLRLLRYSEASLQQSQGRPHSAVRSIHSLVGRRSFESTSYSSVQFDWSPIIRFGLSPAELTALVQMLLSRLSLPLLSEERLTRLPLRVSPADLTIRSLCFCVCGLDPPFGGHVGQLLGVPQTRRANRCHRKRVLAERKVRPIGIPVSRPPDSCGLTRRRERTRLTPCWVCSCLAASSIF
jgi:hypothetical protein